MKDILTAEEQAILLGRPVEQLLTDDDRSHYGGRRCLITGAGGSVGSELSRQLASCRPSRLTLLDQNEAGLFRLEQELKETHPGVTVEPVLADVTRFGSVRSALRQANPEVVFHAAAYKHVTMAERAVCAAARVNVLGTHELLSALRDSGARFVLISSDKAAAPEGVMGATKRFAELLTLAHAERGFTPQVVRFGNVLASSGSFIEIMRERMRSGRSIRLTEPSATRYFMAITEATALVMKAAAHGVGGETFWLDMGEPIRMGELAERLLTIGTQRGWSRVPIDIIGLRPGEKLTEQLATDASDRPSEIHQRVRVERPPLPVLLRVESLARILRRHIGQEDGAGTLWALRSAVAGYEPSLQARAAARTRRAGARQLQEIDARIA